MAWGAGITGTCVSTSENSGGFPTALFFIQSAMSLIAASLSLVLIDGLGEKKREHCLRVSLYEETESIYPLLGLPDEAADGYTRRSSLFTRLCGLLTSIM